MYACLFLPAGTTAASLLELALEFSPAVEQTSSRAVVFSITPLRKLIGSPFQIASEISRSGERRRVRAHLAMTSNPDSAVLLASYFSGVTLVTPGEEHSKLAALPLAALFAYAVPQDQVSLEVLYRWGLKNCGDLAQLSMPEVAEQLGQTGVYLQKLSRGLIDRPLRISPVSIGYAE